MTYMDDISTAIEPQRNINNVGHALVSLLNRAEEAKQVVTGVMDCAQIFQNSSDQVRLCILTETNDVTAQIHQKLVEAFCWENDIPIIMVDSYRKMVTGEDDIDIGCILIQSSTNDKYTEEFIEHYYAMITKHHPVVHLPD